MNHIATAQAAASTKPYYVVYLFCYAIDDFVPIEPFLSMAEAQKRKELLESVNIKSYVVNQSREEYMATIAGIKDSAEKILD